MNEVLETGRYPLKKRLKLKRSSAWLSDPRLIHRGTPNRSDHTRIELVIGYTQSWLGGRYRDAVPELSQIQYDQLSNRGK